MAINTRKKAIAVEPDKPAISLSTRLGLRRGPGDKERKFFTEQMALLLETGTSLQPSLQALKRQLVDPAMIELIEEISIDIEQGKQFSVALAKHPDVFSTTYVNLVAASEEGGFMHQVLEQLLVIDEKREALRKMLAGALSYPIFLLVFALGVVVFVLVVVFPKFTDLFSQIHDQLPATTVFLMAASDILQEHWIPILAGFGGLVILFKLWSASERGKEQLDWAKLNFPMAKGIYTQLYLVQSMRVLSLSLNNGVGIMNSLRSCKEVVDNRLFRKLITTVEEHVEKGSGVAAGFKGTSFIPPIVEQMIHTGEETGNLPKVLNRLSDYFEAELEDKLQTLSRLAEPVMLLVMGGVVGIIVSSLILPIFKLSRAVG